MNASSSRSHSVFEIKLTQQDSSGLVARQAKIILVDLAGSERSKSAGTTSGTYINKSLTVLGRCISALVKMAGKSKVEEGGIGPPWRESVLTWLLRESLTGNSKTTLIAAVSPASVNWQETLSTLRYGAYDPLSSLLSSLFSRDTYSYPDSHSNPPFLPRSDSYSNPPSLPRSDWL